MANFRTGTPAGAASLGNGDVLVPATRRAQQFKTYPVPNYNLALYQLQIRGAVGQNLIDSYIFPLSPENIRKEPEALTAYYDVQGSPAENGVRRVVDVYGLTPPTFLIEGTTGWKLHAMDGYRYTGLQSISRIESLISNFVQGNQSLLEAGNPDLNELWFFDFFRNEYWAVVPIGTQGIRQNAARPLYANYSFRLVATRRLDTPLVSLPDTLASTLSASTVSTSADFQNFVSSFTTSYTNVTAPAQ